MLRLVDQVELVDTFHQHDKYDKHMLPVLIQTPTEGAQTAAQGTIYQHLGHQYRHSKALYKPFPHCSAATTL